MSSQKQKTPIPSAIAHPALKFALSAALAELK